MAFKLTVLVCGLVLSVQHAYSQAIGLGYGNAYGFGPAYGARGIGEVDITAIEIDTKGIGSAYGNGFGIGNAGVGLGAAGFGLAGTGLAGTGLGGIAGTAALAASPAFINLNSFTAGGVLPISSIGPVVPAGLTVVSDNIIEGAVTVNGQLPFLSAVAFEGTLPSAGSGLTQCGCGTAGNIGIISETVGPAPAVAAVNGLGLGGLGLAGVGARGLYL